MFFNSDIEFVFLTQGDIVVVCFTPIALLNSVLNLPTIASGLPGIKSRYNYIHVINQVGQFA